MTLLQNYWLGCALQPFAKCGFFVKNYMRFGMDDISYTWRDFEGKTKAGSIPMGSFLDTAVWLTDFPQFSIINNNYVTYMASTSHTRAYNYQSAGWAYDKAGMQSRNAYENAMLNAEGAYAQGRNTLEAGVNNANLGFYGDLANTAFGAMGSFGSIGAGTQERTGSFPSDFNAVSSGVLGLAQGLINTELNTQMRQNTLRAQGANYDIARDTSSAVARNNLGLANQARQGDYQNTIAGINAQVQDAELNPPSTIGQMGGQGFNWKNGLVGIMVTYKTISGTALKAAADYFYRYGYAVQRFYIPGKVSAMLCMEHFAYWKMQETTIKCAEANESERETMRGVFEKGVTLWATPELIATCPVNDNDPKNGYYLD